MLPAGSLGGLGEEAADYRCLEAELLRYLTATSAI